MRFLRPDRRDALVSEVTTELRLAGVANDVADQAVADYLGLNRTDARCLDIIERLQRVPAGRLAAESGMSTGAVTTVLDRLERAGLARRVPDPADRRRVLAELTPAARRELAALSAPLAAEAMRHLEGYTAEQVCLVRDFMREARRINEAHADRMRALVRARQGAGEAAS
jgi:DNA-binding MarR family transcriptional regulator